MSARLREKATGRKVDLGMTTAERKENLRRFLSSAGANKSEMPAVCTKEGDEGCILVPSDLDFDAPDEIRFIHNEKLSYLFV